MAFKPVVPPLHTTRSMRCSVARLTQLVLSLTPIPLKLPGEWRRWPCVWSGQSLCTPFQVPDRRPTSSSSCPRLGYRRSLHRPDGGGGERINTCFCGYETCQMIWLANGFSLPM
ncbi:hypothetical protein KC19_4G216500 [Ceratodon purpureus]|uniref:Uncharacterized protein n=1 Tax=Ceratodon purpureus TaxID=3225 RepID=A0A8T0IBA7_CERPU|nr:hypothetical protein KC19_4G216500 [Ceratodon purpureus]